VKPLGIMMRAGLVIGLIVGAVALFQIMSSQIESRMRDFAVLRAMGFSASYTCSVGAWQLALMGCAAFAAAWLAAIPVFALVSRKSHLFLPLDGWLLGTGLAVCIPMIASAALPLIRAARAEPAGLFGTG
jgi:putative ABC transport system permease protein